ncbi:T-complex protein 1 subunit gamma [Spiromyces aspiralis]|uniref:T-complex protein 1 subunit gamma n=1 Tax=Spiromyces aspiralis TaxID=68401 RepID=A0ACC1HS48_9FUNG|nr:T-complex protein 1 subunit gamma [Spiromyces aspiralis]
MAVSTLLAARAKSHIEGVEQWPYSGVAEAMEVIPRTLIQNCGGNAVKILSDLRAKHAAGQHTWGVDGETGKLADMNTYGVWEPLAVKLQTIKTAIESACMLLRVDDIVSGTKKSSEV